MCEVPLSWPVLAPRSQASSLSLARRMPRSFSRALATAQAGARFLSPSISLPQQLVSFTTHPPYILGRRRGVTAQGAVAELDDRIFAGQRRAPPRGVLQLLQFLWRGLRALQRGLSPREVRRQLSSTPDISRQLRVPPRDALMRRAPPRGTLRASHRGMRASSEAAACPTAGCATATCPTAGHVARVPPRDARLNMSHRGAC